MDHQEDLAVENGQLKREVRFMRRHVRKLERALSELFKQYCEETKDN
jgi:hypothetical protein